MFEANGFTRHIDLFGKRSSNRLFIGKIASPVNQVPVSSDAYNARIVISFPPRKERAEEEEKEPADTNSSVYITATAVRYQVGTFETSLCICGGNSFEICLELMVISKFQ